MNWQFMDTIFYHDLVILVMTYLDNREKRIPAKI